MPHSCITHQEGVVSLIPRILFDTVSRTGLSISLPSFKKDQICHSGQIDLFVTHHAQVFECVGVG